MALKGLEQLKVYTNLKPNDAEWVVNLDQAPLGHGNQEDEKK